MLNCILLLCLTLRIAPSFISGYFAADDAYSVFYMADSMVILLLSIYAYRTIKWKYRFKKTASVVLIVVSAFFLVNYALVESDTGNIELIGG